MKESDIYEKYNELYQEFLRRDKELLNKLNFKTEELFLKPAPIKQFLFKDNTIILIDKIDDQYNYIQTFVYVLSYLKDNFNINELNFIFLSDRIPLNLLTFLVLLSYKFEKIKITIFMNKNEIEKLKQSDVFFFFEDFIDNFKTLDDAEKIGLIKRID